MITIGFTKITPAEAGTLAAAIDDARRSSLGDDAIVDTAQAALQAVEGMDEKTAADVAYDAWHGGWYREQSK